DVYVHTAPTALGALTVIRPISGAMFPVRPLTLFRTLNPRWVSTLLSCVVVLMIPIPFALKKWGPAL
ncbi:uncharacterized protein BXZ73DRAFT_24496, partial [Epithele typhae]|uniref:uncharacterized protein n=1 Tax=Epithele typhae TaxID=378194 RepID=UPI00200813D8